MTELQRAARGIGLSVAVLLAFAGPAKAQVMDARLIPPGVLRVAFTPEYQNWDRMYDANGSVIPLGKYLSADSAGANLFPTLVAAETAARAISDSQNARFSMGALLTRVDADLRRFPLEFSLGVSSRLTVSATLPIVVTRVNTAISLDSTSANTGWNQADVFTSGNFTGASQIAILITQLETDASGVEAQIAAGSLACPGQSMADAQALVARARALRANLMALTGVLGPIATVAALPHAAPTAGSPLGVAIKTKIAAIRDSLVCYGTSTFPDLPLPSTPFKSSDIQSILANTVFGYQSTIPAYTKRPFLGDMEVGARFGVLQTARARLVAKGTLRLPTGARDLPDNLVDIGTGDRQIDLEAGFEMALESGPLSLTTAGSYNLQLPGTIAKRITPPDQPFALANTTDVLTRKLGDAMSLAAFPALQLTAGFRIYGSVSYYHKGSDHYSGGSGMLDASILDQQTELRSLTLGGGMAYRLLARSTGLPIDAGMSYQTTLSGSGGFTPKATILSMYLRTYYRLRAEKKTKP